MYTVHGSCMDLLSCQFTLFTLKLKCDVSEDGYERAWELNILPCVPDEKIGLVINN